MVNILCSPKIKYFGCIEGDCHNGLGKWLDGYGNQYSGNFKDGKKQGKGSFTYPDGEKWEGIWKGDKRWSGAGTIKTIWYIYKGEYKNGDRNGNGDFTYFNFPNNSRYIGAW